MRPTEIAHMDFQSAGMSGMQAYSHASGGSATKDNYEVRMSQAAASTAYGLDAMATGLRATYLLLEEINRKLDRLSRSQTGRSP